jgi:peptidoglycan/LPS O-acetylase OafA/YrhL
VIGNIAAAAIPLAVAGAAIGVLWSWKVRRYQGVAVAALVVVVVAVLTSVPALRDTTMSHTPGTLVGSALGLTLVYAYRWHQDRQRPARRQ